MVALPPALAQKARLGRLGHAYILVSQEEAVQESLACTLAAALVCTDGQARPCGRCHGCRKALAGTHPDLIHLAPEPGKDLTVGQIRSLRGDAYVRPNEAERKVYLLHQAHRMNPSAQNALLKVLEEGPPYAAFLLLTHNDAALLPTIRSRCETVRLGGEAVAEDPVTQAAQTLAALLLGEDPWALLAFSVPYEKEKREVVVPLWEATRRELVASAHQSPEKAVRLAQGLNQILAAAGQNVGVGALWGWLWAMAQ